MDLQSLPGRAADRHVALLAERVAAGRIALGDLPRRERRAVVRLTRVDPLEVALARVRAAQRDEALAIVDEAFGSAR